MTEPSLDRIKIIFDEVIEADSADRERLLTQLCGTDLELRSRVEALLSAHEQTEDVLASPTVAHANDAATAVLEQLEEFSHEAPGTRIGPYKLLERIGEGGFGVVYMAEQETPIRRRVAVKVIKPGMDSKQVIARFEAERQALALLDHPSIARVLDAGATERGRPYFVMELVRGIPINEYCDANRLSARERLDLFRQVCGAIQHAHKNGIVHRDIKPSNILVTLHDGIPVPKIIDFGVAKAMHQRLTEKTLFTNYNQFIGTPTYMSPEQAALGGLEIDARSDIYSLGVLLYELLTGTTPFDARVLQRAAHLELLRILRDEEPLRPSTRLSTLGDESADVAKLRQADIPALARLLRGDLDWIVMKALEKDRTRRYQTAADLAADITRHFNQEPITAHPPSLAYHTRKFVHKRRRPIAAVAAFMALGLTAATASTLQRRAEGAQAQPSTPTRRLALDRLETYAGWPQREGGDYLRYDTARGGFELFDTRTQRTTPLTRGRPDMRVGSAILTTDRKRIAASVWLASSSDNAAARPARGPVDLRLFDVGGEAMGRSIHTWDDGSSVSAFGWSPDQSRVWVFIMRPDRTAEIASVRTSDGAFEVLRTLTWRTLTQVPSLSPDGHYIAYHDADVRDGPNDVFVIATDGSRQTRIENPADDLKPMFTPDGAGIVFQSDRRDGIRDLWFQPVTDGRPTGEPRVVVADISPFGTVKTFADDGSLYYFFATTRWEIFTGRIASTGGAIELSHVAPRTGEMNNGPSFSPDGAYLAHLRDSGRRLVIRTIANGAEREIPMPASSLAPTSHWCTDGRTVFVLGWGQDVVIYRVDVESGLVKRVALDAGEIVCPDDGRSLVYMHDVGDVQRIARRDLTTGAETELFSGPARQLQRSQDGSMIGFIAGMGDSARIVVVPARGGAKKDVAPARVLTDFGRSFADRQFMFAPEGNGVIVVRDPSLGEDAGADDARSADSANTRILEFVPFDGTAARTIGTFERPAFENDFYGSMNYSMHPDGTMFAFEKHAGSVVQDWAIDNLLPFIHSGLSWDAITPRR